MLEAGTKAPEFTLPDQNGEMHSLSDYKGQKVILYFYPKDSTAGCTKQACGFGERYPQFREKGAVVLGVSKDSVASHKTFDPDDCGNTDRHHDLYGNGYFGLWLYGTGYPYGNGISAASDSDQRR